MFYKYKKNNSSLKGKEHIKVCFKSNKECSADGVTLSSSSRVVYLKPLAAKSWITGSCADYT